MGFIKRETQKCGYSDRFTQYISIAADKRGPCAYIYSHKDFIYSFRDTMKKLKGQGVGSTSRDIVSGGVRKSKFCSLHSISAKIYIYSQFRNV